MSYEKENIINKYKNETNKIYNRGMFSDPPIMKKGKINPFIQSMNEPLDFKGDNTEGFSNDIPERLAVFYELTSTGIVLSYVSVAVEPYFNGFCMYDGTVYYSGEGFTTNAFNDFLDWIASRGYRFWKHNKYNAINLTKRLF